MVLQTRMIDKTLMPPLYVLGGEFALGHDFIVSTEHLRVHILIESAHFDLICP